MLDRPVEVKKSTSNTFDKLVFFGRRQGISLGIGLSMSYLINNKVSISAGLLVGVLKYEYSFGRDLAMSLGINSSQVKGLI
ncbi:MAG: hypothetical protein ACJAR3_001227 [Roseivirga sp.]|jgi:hypothetical protein